MAKRNKAGGAGSPIRGRLEGLLAVGDLGGARAEARRVLAEASSSETDRELARVALSRASPERGAAIAALLGLAFYAAVALAGLLGHR